MFTRACVLQINHGEHTHKDFFLVHPVDTLTYFRSLILLYKVLRLQYLKKNVLKPEMATESILNTDILG
jgi:hypothetical protein